MKQILLFTLLLLAYSSVGQCDSITYERFAYFKEFKDGFLYLKHIEKPTNKYDGLTVQLYKFNKESSFNPNISKWSFIGEGKVINHQDGFKIKLINQGEYNVKALKLGDDIKVTWKKKAKTENIIKIEGTDTLYYGKLLCNNKVGTWKYFYPNNKIKNITNYNNKGELDGEYKIFHKDGGYLYEAGNYKNGKLDGKVHYYYANGKVKKEIPFVNGKREGTVTKYFSNGNIQYIEHYKDGKICCQAQDFYESGQPKIVTYYKNGKIDSTYTFFFENGTIKSKLNYNEGKKNGLAELHYENGQLNEKVFFINDKKVGEYISYYENGQLKAKGLYVNGKKVGLWKEYYENGKKKSKGKFKNDGTKTGKWKDWDENGKKTKSVY